MEHLEAMLGCEEVHVWWDPTSSGSHFDLGMAYMLHAVRFVLHCRLGREGMAGLKSQHDITIGPPIHFVVANRHQVEQDSEKSFTNVLLELASRPRIET